jgi:hemerythrin superfamily protein
MMNGLDLLIADHNRVRGLFARFRELQGNDDTPRMGELASRIFEELEVHTALEEQILYPAVRDLSEELAEVVNEGVQEHHVVDVLIEEARTLKPGDAEWIAKVAVLIENVEHHAEEEETELFPTTKELRQRASRQQIPGRSTMSRDDLVATIDPR